MSDMPDFSEEFDALVMQARWISDKTGSPDALQNLRNQIAKFLGKIDRELSEVQSNES